MADCLVKLLVVGSSACLLLITLIHHQRCLEHTPISTPLTTQTPWYTDTIETFAARIKTEHKYKTLLGELSKDELETLEGVFHRDLTIQYSGRDLLPPSLPIQHWKCLDHIHTTTSDTLSVVIVYYNEVPTLLMRTLTTIFHRTLPRYLLEIIVIDDASEIDISEEILSYSESQHIPIRFIRNEFNLGIARSRLRGIEEAAGDLVALFDSHVEVSDLWLEPLIQILTKKPDAITVPHMHMIQETEYNELHHPYRWVTTLENLFGSIFENMITFPSIEPWESYPSSALMGGAIVARREVLRRLYPTPLLSGSKWGVENSRLSYRAWMCGGGIWSNDCSQVRDHL
eukprot:sb/3466376/